MKPNGKFEELERNAVSEQTENLIQNENNETKPCAYPTCKNVIPRNNEYQYCEVCRTMAIRNAITIVLDPTSPVTERSDSIFHTAICNMRPEEILNAAQKTEWAYLQFQKAIKSHQLDLPSNKRGWKNLQDEVNEARSIESQTTARRKANKKKESRKDKAIKLLGERGAKEILGDDFSDL